MDEKTIALVQKIMDSIGVNKDFVIDAYAKWYLAQSASLLLLGFFTIFAGWFIVPKKNESLEKCEAGLILPIVKWVLTAVGILFIVVNFPNLISRKG